MREIFFRGKRKDNGKWAEGYYVKAEKLNCGGYEHFIIEENANGTTYEVIPETVGQYTGLTANGTKIFEGDIITNGLYTYIIRIGEYAPKNVYYITDNSKCKVDNLYGVYAHCVEDETFDCIIPNKTFQKIGNIHDNSDIILSKFKVILW